MILRRCFSASAAARAASTVKAEVTDGVQNITLSSPKTRNALSLEVMRALRSELASGAADEGVRCVVVRGDGPVFSAGHNLKEMTSADGRAHHEAIFAECNGLMRDLVRLPTPVVAAVDGVAAAAGCQLVAICDMAVATEKSTFSTPGANFGIFCSTPGIPLARATPRKMSSYMLFTGNPITADEALRSGLISKMVSDSEELKTEVDAICEAIKAKSRAVVQLGKEFYYRQLEMGLSQALDAGGRTMVDNLEYADAQEGISAFKEKRKPTWTHKK